MGCLRTRSSDSAIMGIIESSFGRLGESVDGDSPHGEVKRYMLSPEELEKYRAIPSEPYKKPIVIYGFGKQGFNRKSRGGKRNENI